MQYINTTEQKKHSTIPYFPQPFIAFYLQLFGYIKFHKIDPLPHIYARKMCAIYMQSRPIELRFTFQHVYIKDLLAVRRTHTYKIYQQKSLHVRTQTLALTMVYHLINVSR